MKKYKLISSEKDGLYRIQALRSFNGVQEGEIGGLVQSEDNLSHEGNSWIYDDARVINNASVSGDATVQQEAVVSGEARICGNARIYGGAVVKDSAYIFNNAEVFDDAEVSGHAVICQFAKVFGRAQVSKYAVVDGNAEIAGDAVVTSIRDYVVFKNFWATGTFFTWTASNGKFCMNDCLLSASDLMQRAAEDVGMYAKIIEFVNSI